MKPQQGSVIIVTLWTIILLTILVTVIASQIRLSAQVVYYHQQELDNWANTLAAINQAEMELMLERMPLPIQTIDDLSEINRNPLYRYNGEEIALEYPSAENITVRIYDHAGKINLRGMNQPRMRLLLEKRLGEDADQQIDQLLAAWTDWQDISDGTDLNGAERDYYETLDQPYTPRNGPLESVEELLLIRGFAEVFTDVNLEAAFTLYSGEGLLNLNLATIETMELLPGLDDELIEEILVYRQENDILNNNELSQFIPVESMSELQLWVDNNLTSGVYTILSYKSPEDGLLAANMTGYAEVVRINSFTQKPEILKISPYTTVPLSPITADELENQ